MCASTAANCSLLDYFAMCMLSLISLAQYDANYLFNSNTGEKRDCILDEIVLYDVSPPPAGFSKDDIDKNQQTSSLPDKFVHQSSADPRPPNWQGSRVSSIQLRDGSVVELGASIIYEGNQLVVDMINGDPSRLKKGKPMGTGKKRQEQTSSSSGDDTVKPNSKKIVGGFGIYHGDQQWLLNTASFSNYPSSLQSILKPLYFLWRYNFDYFRLKGAVKQAIQSFEIIYSLLNDTQHDVTYFESRKSIQSPFNLHPMHTIVSHCLIAICLSNYV